MIMFCHVAIDPNQHFVFTNTLNSNIINLNYPTTAYLNVQCLADFWNNQQSCPAELMEDLDIELLMQNLELCLNTLRIVKRVIKCNER